MLVLNQLKIQEDVLKISEKVDKVQEVNIKFYFRSFSRKEENIEDYVLSFEQCTIKLGPPENSLLNHLVTGMKGQDRMILTDFWR